MERLFMALSGASGFLAVALGAFGAHGLKARLSSLPDFEARMDWWQLAAHYHLMHALALAAAGYLAQRGTGTPAVLAGWGFVAGVTLFSGSLYVMTITGIRVLGAVTPFGGLLLLSGWACLLWAALRLPH